MPPLSFDDADRAAVRIVDLVGKRLRVAIPLAIGKPNHLVNALYRLAQSDRGLSLEIFSGLTLVRPVLKPGLEAAYAGPIVEATFAGYPELSHANDLRDGILPPNVTVNDFFLQAGAWLGNRQMQQQFVSLGYAAVAAHLRRRGINVLAQLVAPDPAGGGKLSLSCNTDITLELTDYVDGLRAAGKPVAMVGEVNANLPYMPGKAEIAAGWFDLLVEPRRPHFPLLALPREAVPLTVFATALHAATLIEDGGTLQIGIGSFADALSHALILRHTRNAQFRAMLASLGTPLDAGTQTAPFQTGLYACSEMLVDGFMALKQAGILKRRVPVLDDAGQPTSAQALVHAGFFFGHRDLYAALRAMPMEERAQIAMTGIGFTNTLFGQEAQKRAQRVKARFVNSGMIATLLGAVSSDQLGDGRVVSGFGGQHDFAVMAAELEGARSIIAIRATRKSSGRTTSNIVWAYPNATLPRHLRDIVVTEYGIADLRGLGDRDCIAAMLQVADAAFQPGLQQAATAAGKLERGWAPDPSAPANSAARVEAALAPYRRQGLLPLYPFGSDLSEIEQRLAEPLERLKAASRLELAKFLLRGLMGERRSGPENEALARLALDRPAGFKARAMQAVVLGLLRS